MPNLRKKTKTEKRKHASEPPKLPQKQSKIYDNKRVKN